jgi:hypothetical protein
MRLPVFLMMAACVCAQDASRQYSTSTYDVHGRRVPSGTRTEAGGSRSETLQSINGRTVPLETAEEVVISDGPEGRVVERSVRKFDATGRPSASEKVVTQETKHPDGSSTISKTTYDSDLGGRFTLRERSTTETRKEGDRVSEETRTERPSLNGSLQLEERKVAITTGDQTTSRTDMTVYRRAGGSSLVETERQSAETRSEDGQTTTTTLQYNTAATGRMEMTGQRVSRLTRSPDGSEVEVVDIYGSTAAGRASGGPAGPKLKEQQIIERTPGPNDSLSETFSVRRTELDSERLGPAQRISETTCTGSCKN